MPSQSGCCVKARSLRKLAGCSVKNKGGGQECPPHTGKRPPAAAFDFWWGSSVADARPLRRLRDGRGGGGGRGFVQYAVMDGEQRQLQPVGDTGFVVDVAQVVLGDLLGGGELGGDFL